MRKINFKQPKYIFPAIVFVPIVGLAYCITSMIGGPDNKSKVPTDQINTEMPDAKAVKQKDKYEAMMGHYENFGSENITAMEQIDLEKVERERLESSYTDEEIEKIMAEAEAKETERKNLEEIQKQIINTARSLPSQSGNAYRQPGGYDPGQPDAAAQASRKMRQIQEEAYNLQQEIINRKSPEQIEEEVRDKIAREQAEMKKKENPPVLVEKTVPANAAMFNTVTEVHNSEETPLIRAMIDKTTKVINGTRIRFKLLDDVTVRDVRLHKGAYLYGIVSGFGQQRVKANVTSILVGNRFLKVNLAVFDIDGMEGFYVPSSAFREFVKEAGGDVLGTNMQFTQQGGSYGNEINGELLALQALQNVYNSGTKALTANLKKNKAKIKYNTTIYLVNSQDAR